MSHQQLGAAIFWRVVMSTKILIVDDHEIVREGIRTLVIKSRRKWEIAGEARNGTEALEAVKSLNPDVVILDITMPGMSGLEAASEISKLGSHSHVLIFTMHDSPRLIHEVRAAGAQGYVLKSQAARDLIRAIDALLEGGTFFGAPSKQHQDQKENGPTPGILRRVRFA
jgi:DNA-binding NarL/FixJ family response regulator